MSKLDRLQWELSTFLARLRVKAKGAQLGNGARFLGQPIVSVHPGSRLSIGSRLVATSRSTGTALGVRSAVILRTLSPDASLVLGDDNGLSGTVICAAVEVRIGSRCLFGADCMIFDTDFHNLEVGGGDQPYRRHSSPNWKSISSPVCIGDDVFLGTRSTVTKGVTIGSGSIIAAGSVVTSDIPPNCVAAGVPARVIRTIENGYSSAT
jgi:hypothetical protein